MTGDVLDWDAWFHLLCLLGYVMGIRLSKGPTAPLDFAGPPGNPEQEAEGQKETLVITRENTSSLSPPSSPNSLPSEASSHSLSKECDTTSTTEDTSFASCLTGDPSCASELSPASPVKDLSPSLFSKNSGGEACAAEKSINSVSDSVAQNSAQNGVKKDSEYESAEELDLSFEPTSIVTVQPSTKKSQSPVTNEAEVKKQEASVVLGVLETFDDTSVHEESPRTQIEIVPVVFESPVVSEESTSVILDKESDNLALQHCEKLQNTVCDSLVTVTKTEIIEDSISKSTDLSDQPVINSGSEVNGVLTFNICAQSTENQCTSLSLENSTVNSEESSNTDVEIENCKFQASESQPEKLISEIKGSEDQLDTPDNDEYKVKDNESNCDLQSNNQIESKTSESEHESIVQTDNRILSEDPNSCNTTPVTEKDKTNSNLQSDGQIVSKVSENVVQADIQVIGEDQNNSNTTDVIVNLQSEQVDNQQSKDTVNNNSELAFEEKLSSIETLEAPQEKPPQPSDNFIDPEDIPIIPQKSYNLDFLDNLDDPNFNPFATKTYIRSSPPPSPEPGCKLPPLKPAIQKRKLREEPKKAPSEPATETTTRGINVENQIKQEKQETNTFDALKLETDNNLQVPHTAPLDEFAKNPENQSQSVEQNSEQLLEITFDEPVSRPPRKLGKKPQLKQKRSPTAKAPPESKPIEKNNNRLEEKTVSEPETKFDQEEIPIPPSKGYNLDFLDNLDDPNFNPFATKCAVSNSPPKEDLALTEDKSKDKPKASTPKKAPAKKGFTVIKNKAKTKVPSIDDTDLSKEIVNVPEDSDKGVKFAEEKEDTPLTPKKDYNLDFLDDPNFDPFQSRSPLDKNTSTVRESDSSNIVPKDIDTAKVNSVNIQTKSDTECDKDSATDFRTQVEYSKDSLPEASQENIKEESLLVISKEEPRETNYLIEKEDKPEVIESNVSEEETRVSIGDTQGCDAKSLISQEEVHSVIDSSKNQTEEKCEAGAEHLQLRSSSVSEDECPAVLNKSPEPKLDLETEEYTNKEFKENISNTEIELNLPKVPSIGTIGQLDSLEFAQLLGNEASRLAEEFMNCSTDSGLPDSDDSSYIKSHNIESTMADMNCTKSPQYGARLDENVNPFQKHSRLSRSPPLGKREAVCGAESGDVPNVHDPFKARRSLKRESVMGEERLDTLSLDDDSGIVLGTRSDLETEVNHSEAGPEIATGLTSSDLRCASQLKTEDEAEEMRDQITDEEFLASETFFKEATDMENQLRKSLATPLMGSHSKLSGDEVTPTRDRRDHPAVTPVSPQHKQVPSTSSPAPPREERSAPEGTSSPTPRPSDTSERKSSSRPSSIPPEGYVTAAEVQDLLKRQELKFEEKLLQVELAAGEKEKQLRETMKDEQKELTTLGESMAELTNSRDALLKMVGQYKGMLASLVSEKEKEKQNADERIKALEVERNQALEDLANVEVAFSDVHRKYERTKQVVDTLRRNEETLRGAVADYETKLQKQEQKFIEFQKHAEEKIQLANEEFEAMRKANDQEMTKMAALLKKAEMKIMSLQDSFDRKTRENQELTQLCDDLINKVGSSH
nr:protein P200-like isoform X2 [Procambarus clarkii]